MQEWKNKCATLKQRYEEAVRSESTHNTSTIYGHPDMEEGPHSGERRQRAGQSQQGPRRRAAPFLGCLGRKPPLFSSPPPCIPSPPAVLNDEEFFDALEIGLDQLEAEAEAANSLELEETVQEVRRLREETARPDLLSCEVLTPHLPRLFPPEQRVEQMAQDCGRKGRPRTCLTHPCVPTCARVTRMTDTLRRSPGSREPPSRKRAHGRLVAVCTPGR